MISILRVGISSSPLPAPRFTSSPLGVSCRRTSKRNSCSSRGVTVTSGVIQCGCSACVRETRSCQSSMNWAWRNMGLSRSRYARHNDDFARFTSSCIYELRLPAQSRDAPMKDDRWKNTLIHAVVLCRTYDNLRQRTPMKPFRISSMHLYR